MTSAAGAATKFRVWRAYHELEAELGRFPNAAEVAELSGVNHVTVSYCVRKLKTCQVRQCGNPGPYAVEYDNKFAEPDVVELMNRHL